MWTMLHIEMYGYETINKGKIGLINCTQFSRKDFTPSKNSPTRLPDTISHFQHSLLLFGANLALNISTATEFRTIELPTIV